MGGRKSWSGRAAMTSAAAIVGTPVDGASMLMPGRSVIPTVYVQWHWQPAERQQSCFAPSGVDRCRGAGCPGQCSAWLLFA
jgi:hypothetical protein